MHTLDQIILQVSEKDQTFNQIPLSQNLFDNSVKRKSPKKERLKIFDIRKQADSIKIAEIIEQIRRQERCCQTEQYQKAIAPSEEIDKIIKKQEELIIHQQQKEQKQELQNNEPKSFRWIQKRPYHRVVTSFEQKVIKVPVQKVIPSQYEIQHIVEYIKKEVTEIKPELEKRQYLGLKLNYQPVDRLIIHMPQNCINNKETKDSIRQYSPKLQNKLVLVNGSQSVQQLNTIGIKQNQKTYLVTSSHYDFDLRSKKWDLIMNEIQNLKEKQKALNQLKGLK